MDEPVIQTEGDVMPGDPVVPSYDPPYPETTGDNVSDSQTERTFVVSESVQPTNQFAPQVVTETSSDVPPPDPNQPMTVAPSGGSPWIKRLLALGVFFIIILLVVLLGKYLLGLTAGSKSVTLTYWGLWEDSSTLQGVLKEFETLHPKIKVNYIKQSHQQYRERLQAAIDRGDGPDVFRFHNTWVPMFRNELAPAGKDVMTTSEFSSTFYPVASQDLVGGQYIYGMPMMIDGLGLYYNEDIFASAGVSPPETWPDVLTIVPKLTVRDGTTILTSAIALGTAGNIENFSDILATMMMQNGAKLITPTGTQAEQALTFYRKFSDPNDPVYTWNDSMDNSIYAFASGKVAMILAPSWRVFDVKQINPSLNFKIIPIPQLPGNTLTWASYWVEGVSAKSKNQVAAWELVKYMASRDVVTKMYTEESKTRLFGEPYARVDMASAISADPYVGAYIQQAATAKSFPLASRTHDNGINDRLIKYLLDAVNSVVENGTAPSAALDTAANGFSQVLTSYGLTTGSAPTTSQ
jgi:multiple sugar transport system substrate-binding protein